MGRAPTLTPHASVAHFLGAELRHRREHAELSINQLAPRVLASPDLLAKVERAERFPSADVAARCDHELGAGGYLIRLHGFAAAERVRHRQDDRMGLPGLSAGETVQLRRLLAAIELVASAQRPTPRLDLLDRIDGVLSAADAHTSNRSTMARRTR